MIELAARSGEAPMTSRDLAKRQGLSVKYLEQLLTPLKQAGLVKSLRGPRGGYLLAKNPDELSLFELMRVLEGPVAMVDCVNDPVSCHRNKHCAVRDVWVGMSRTAEDYLASVSLSSLVKAEMETRGKI